MGDSHISLSALNRLYLQHSIALFQVVIEIIGTLLTLWLSPGCLVTFTGQFAKSSSALGFRHRMHVRMEKLLWA